MGRWLALAALAVMNAAHTQEASREKQFTNKAWRWSIAVPAGWTVDSRDPDLVRVRSAADNALCSIHSGAMDRFNSVDELTDFLLGDNERLFKGKGVKFRVLARQKVTLPGNIVGNDVLADVGPIRSQRLYVLADGRGFAVDCESRAKNWSRFEASYRRIIDSFTVGK